MYKTVGRVMVAETKQGVSELVVSVSALPFAKTGTPNEQEPSSDPRVRSLGSVVTDRFGGFEITYNLPHESSDHVSETEHWSLVVAVFAPDVCGSEATDELLCKTRPRTNPGSVESYVIRILAARLQAAGIDSYPRESAQLNDNPFASDRTRRVLQDFAARHRPKTTFVERYVERHAREAELERVKGVRRRSPFTFDIATPVNVSTRSEADKESLIEFDRDKEQLILRDGSGGEPLPLRIEDVITRTSSTHAEESAGGVGIHISRDNGKLLLELPRIPTRLTATEREPGALHRWYTRSRLTDMRAADGTLDRCTR